ncbi:hypothetical protein ACS0TY_033806 [Phlomoides rotata]
MVLSLRVSRTAIEDYNMGTHRGGIESWEDEERITLLEKNSATTNEKLGTTHEELGALAQEMAALRQGMDALRKTVETRVPRHANPDPSSEGRRQSKKCSRPKVEFDEEIELHWRYLYPY